MFSSKYTLYLTILGNNFWYLLCRCSWIWQWWLINREKCWMISRRRFYMILMWQNIISNILLCLTIKSTHISLSGRQLGGSCSEGNGEAPRGEVDSEEHEEICVLRLHPPVCHHSHCPGSDFEKTWRSRCSQSEPQPVSVSEFVSKPKPDSTSLIVSSVLFWKALAHFICIL